MDNFIQSEFDSFLRDVIPVEAPTVQIVEFKRAFFAGAQAMLSRLLKIGEDSVSEDAGIEWLESATRELLKFKDDVVAGRA